ncbi:MAG TPA: CHASE2 domain-containing protein, partial [Terriglobales bacterium]|nr:CHASE2 domain-containing protein [Terriglobales bacterium]
MNEKVAELQGRVGDLMAKLPAKKIEMTIAAVVTAVGLVLYAFVGIPSEVRPAFSFVKNVEQRALDARFRYRGGRAPDPRIVIVGIDEKTLQKVAWPIPRSAYAKMLDRMTEGGAKLVSFDVTFPTPQKNSAVDALKSLESELAGAATPAVLAKIHQIEQTSDNDVLLADAIKRNGNVILGEIFLYSDRAAAIDPAAQEEYFKNLWLHPFPQ